MFQDTGKHAASDIVSVGKVNLTASDRKEAERLLKELGKNYAVQMLPLEGLTYDTDYHDDVDPKRVARIVAEFMWPALNPIIVSERAGLQTVNGRHTTVALIEKGYTHGPQIRLRDMTQKQEAALYLAIQNHGTHKTLSKKASFAARVVAGESVALNLDKIFKRVGFSVNSAQGKYPVQGLEKYERAYSFDKGESLERAMCKAKAAWPRVSIPGNQILAIAAICHVGGGVVCDNDLTETLRGENGASDPNAWTQQVTVEFGSVNKRAVPYCLAKLICDSYSARRKAKRIDTQVFREKIAELLPMPKGPGKKRRCAD